MKILIISDIHSNIVALEEVWKHESDADLIVSAGDTVDCGPFPCECIDWVTDHDVITVRGNHDQHVLDSYLSPNVSNNWHDHNARLLQPHHVEYLKALPNFLSIDLDGQEFGLTHLYQRYDIIETKEEFQRFTIGLFRRKIDRMIFGHTHKRAYHELANGIYWINPGSISYRHGERIKGKADYLILQDGKLIHKRIDFPSDKLHKAALAADVCEAARANAFNWW